MFDRAAAHRLRDLSPADAPWIHEACQDAEIQRWTLVPRPYTRAHADDFVVNGAGEKRVWVVCDEVRAWGDVQSVMARIASTNEASRATVRRVGFTVDASCASATCPDGDVQVDAVTFCYSLA